MAVFGYAGKILRIDLTSGKTSELSTMDYADRFLGGMGVAAKICWDEVPPEAGAFDPENRLFFMNGPLAGFAGVSGSRWIVGGKCPTTTPETFATCNLGGRWGAQLKFAGYDGIVVQGKSAKPVYLFVEDGVARIRDASALWGKGAIEAREILKRDLGSKVSVAACGPAGENLVTFATVVADNDACGGSGFGAVMGSKNLKAIAVRGSGKPTPANPERLGELRKRFRELWAGVKVIDNIGIATGRQTKDPCYGCVGACHRGMRVATDGTQHKALCSVTFILNQLAAQYYGKPGESYAESIANLQKTPAYDVSVHIGRLLDDVGLDSDALLVQSIWLAACSQMGILTDEDTGIPFSKFGSREFFESFLRKITYREGFGDILARGTWEAADRIGGGARELLYDSPPLNIGKDGRTIEYCPRAFPAHALLFALEPAGERAQEHEMAFTMYRWLCWADKDYERNSGMLPGGRYVSSEVFREIGKTFWGSEQAADFSTYEGKALAVKKIQDREYVKESLGLCDWVWPVLGTASDDYVGDPSLESNVFSAVTGNEVDEEGLYLAGERMCNLRRALLVRQRRSGREGDTIPDYFFKVPLEDHLNLNPDCIAPGKNGEIVSLKGTVVSKEGLEGMKDEYYRLRGWDVATGLQTRAQLEGLGLDDIADDLEQRGLLALGGQGVKPA